MNICLLPLGSLSLAVLLAVSAVPAHAYDTDSAARTTCESHFNKTQHCPFEGRARLVRQLSVTRCVEDDNWGQRRGMLWVTDGCRAEFVADRRGRSRWPGHRGERNEGGQRLLCESYARKEKQCRIRVRDEVRLVRQTSVTACIEDRNWGWDRRGVWVSDGCRAEFRVY